MPHKPSNQAEEEEDMVAIYQQRNNQLQYYCQPVTTAHRPRSMNDSVVPTSPLTSSRAITPSNTHRPSVASPKPCPPQRQFSDGTAILTAARALLSLSPEENFSAHRNKCFKASAAATTASVPPLIPSMSQEESEQKPIPSLFRPVPTSSSFHPYQVQSTTPDTVTKQEIKNKPLKKQPLRPDFQRSSNNKSESAVVVVPPKYYTGSTSLSLPTDEDSLSPLHCFMRKYCVEAFTANPADVALPKYGRATGRRVTVGQIGIRCLHCQHRTLRQERAVCFPSSLKNIYHSIETWQRRHSLVCQDIPMWIKQELTLLMEHSRSGAGGRRQYWEESAKRLGMVDTENGLRFICPPGEVLEKREQHEEQQQQEVVTLSTTTTTTTQERFPLVTEADRSMVTDYLFVLLEQMESCYFAEQDRTGGRSKIKDCPVGYPGLQCKHCGGKAGFGRYFPTSLRALTSANSDRNIYNHIMKCRRCPQTVRDRLFQLQRLHNEQHCKNRRGWRKQFFGKMWRQLHASTNTASMHVDSDATESLSSYGKRDADESVVSGFENEETTDVVTTTPPKFLEVKQCEAL